jgi:PAS domain S-box-containing protein
MTTPERILSRTIDNLLEGCQVIGPDFRYLYVNNAVAAHGRTTREALLGRTMPEAYPGIEHTEMFSALRRCMEQRAAGTMENEFAFPDGSTGWFELRFEPVPEGVAILSMDITERRRADEALVRSRRALHVLSESRQTQVRATDEQRFMEDVCRIAEKSGYLLAWIGFRQDDPERSVRPVAQAGRDDGYLEAARTTWDETERGSGPVGTAIRTGRPTVARSIATDPAYAPWRAAAIERGFASCIALPITEHAETFGALTIYAGEPDAFDAAECALLEEMVLDLGYGITTLRGRAARQKAVEAQERSQTRYRELVENIEDIVYSLDAEGRIEFINPAVERVYGFTADEVMGRSFLEFMHPDDVPGLVASFERDLAGVVEPYEGRGFDKEGRVRYLRSTSRVRLEEGRPMGVDGVMVDITGLRQAEEALRAERDRAQTYLDMAGVMFVALDRDGTVTLVNRKGCEILGLEESEILGRNWFDHFIPESAAVAVKRVFERIVAGEVEPVEFHENAIVASGGGERLIAWHNSILRDEEGSIVGTVSSGEDITDSRRAEEERLKLQTQLQLSQKLEAVGRLAGGVAHDFNNMLSVIISYAEFAATALHEGDPVRADVLEIRKAGERAATLTRQLLAFSRRQVLEPRVLDLNEVVGGIEGMLRRLLGEDIEIAFRPAEGLGSVRADPGQIEQVIVNLAINARDAMPEGGRLTIETAHVEVDEDYAARHVSVLPGRYVLLSVTDTGCGMDAKVRERLFEPFFTTKEVGRGTGLGLATCYGIVKQSGGNIWVYSEPGQGTTFKVYLPRVDAPATGVTRRSPVTMARGTETVLLVEDEDAVRGLAERILRSAGYEVLAAAGSGEALLMFEKHASGIDLLLTDVVMPRVSGRELAERLTNLRSGLKVLFMSGYMDNAIVQHGVLDPGTHFIGKPFSSAELTSKVRDVLDGE